MNSQEKDPQTGVLLAQKKLAEITEMLYIVHKMHYSLSNRFEISRKDLYWGKGLIELAKLQNQDVFSVMNLVVINLIQSEFLGLKDWQNNPLPAKPGGKIRNTEWALWNILREGGLIGKSCKGGMILGGAKGVGSEGEYFWQRFCFSLASRFRTGSF